MSNALAGTLGGTTGAGAGAGAVACGGAAAGAAARAAGCAAAASVTRVSTRLPALTRSPIFTFKSCTTPPRGDGTSIDALSDSSVISGCSAVMLSPLLTITSMMGTSLKSPISGTRTSATPAGALVEGGGEDTAGLTGSEAAPARSISSVRIAVPSLTRSPILTATDLTVPAAGEGTSMDALSDSSVISGSSALTRSPAFTVTSMIGTSLKSPMSGTRTCLISLMRLPSPVSA